MNSSDDCDASLGLCLRKPIPAITDAARYLDTAVSAHLRGKPALAEELIRLADMVDIRKWTESIRGDDSVYVRFPNASGAQPCLSKEHCAKARMPTGEEKQRIHQRDG